MEHKTQRRRRRSKQYEEFPSYENRYDYYEEHHPGYSPGYSPIRTTHDHNHERSYRSESRGSRCRSEQSRHSRSSSSRYSSNRSRLKDPEYQRKRQEHYQLDQRHHRRSYHDGHRRPRPNDQYETGWFSPSAGYDRRSRRRDHLAHFGFEIDGQTRETIRRIAFSTLVASVTVLVICGLARWKEVERPQSEGPLWDLDQIKAHIFSKIPTCEGVGIASILIGLLYL